MTILRTTILNTVGLLTTATLHAQLLSHEPFVGYSSGAELQTSGAPAVAGYTGPWVDVAFGDAEPKTATGSLIYSDPTYLGATGDRVIKQADANGIQADNCGRVERLLDSALVVNNATVGTRYLSWLFKTGNENAAGDPAIYQTLALWNGTGGNDGNRRFDAGVASGDFGTTNYAFRLNNSLVGNLGLASNSNVHLFVAKFTFGASSGGDSVRVWIDPVLGGGDPGGGVTRGGIDLEFDRLVLSDYASNSSEWDEIRWGSTFDSVTLAPPGPTFFVQPSSYSGSVGDTLSLVADVSGNPPPSLQWETSDTGTGSWIEIPGATGEVYAISDAPYSANGFYRLVASNTNGTLASDVVEVTLSFPPPQITEQPKPVGSMEGGEASFSVVASGLGNLSYQWRKDGIDLVGETGSTLALTNLNEDDLGIYSVLIQDDAALAESLPPAAIVSDSVLLIFGNIGDYQSGLTYRLFDIQEPMDQLYPLVPGQTPNVDEKRQTIDWSGSADFSGFTQQIYVEATADLFVPVAGTHEFRLTSSDGSELWIDDILVIDHDGEHAATAMDGNIALGSGQHPLRVKFFLNSGTPELKLEWRLEGKTEFSLVPEWYYLTPSFVTRVVAPGKKEIITPDDGTRPGSGAPLVSVHPEWEVHTIHPSSFNPKVGAMAVHPDGRLFISTFEPNQNNNSSQPTTPNGQVWALTNVEGNDPEAVSVAEVANGLFEPAGMTFVDGVLYVSQRLEVTRLLDNNSDGFYETHETVGSGWESNNYHMFHFGLIESGGFAYSTLSTSIIFSYTGLNGPNPANRGTWVRTNLATGQVDYLAGGLRTPNGIGFGPDGDVFQTDNQGSWLPASRLNHLRSGHFYGHYNNTADGGVPSLYSEQPPTPPAVYLPQNEISNSPTQPLLIPEGHDFAGDMLVGELTLGGIRRVSLEKVNGEWQGAVYRFTQGFEAGVNRIEWAPDGSLYVGCIGAAGNWSWNGTTRGLQRLSPKAGANETFEIDRVEATPTGFRIKYTKPVPAGLLNDPSQFVIKQWTYSPSQDYGGDKVDLSTLPVSTSVASADRKSVTLTIPGLKSGYVVYLKSDLVSDFGEAIWSSEAWYTLNAIPGATSVVVQLDSDDIPENAPAGTAVGSLSVTGGEVGDSFTYSLPAVQEDNRYFSISGDTLVSATPFDYERRSSYAVRVQATSSSGAFGEAEFTISVNDVAGESAPSRITLSNAVLPPDHQVGALVGFLGIDDSDLGDLVEIPMNPVGGASVVYEGFNYPAGSMQAGLGSGSGFSGSWQGIGAGAVVSSESLSYADQEGRQLHTSGNSAYCEPYSRNHRALANARGTDGTVSYVSFLAHPIPNLHFWGVEFWNGGAADGNRVLQVGNEGGFGVRVRNGTNKFFGPADNGAHLFVLRIDHLAGNDKVSAWIDPTLSAEPAAPDLEFSAAESGGSIIFDRIGFSAYVSNTSPVVDELRIGDTWASVTPNVGSFPFFELVAGDGDVDNGLFRLQGSSLYAAGAVPPGLRSVRVRVTDSTGNAFEQVLLVWVGSGHTDSNGDGITDGDAVRLGYDPEGDDARDGYFGAGGAVASIDHSIDLTQVDVSMTPGNLYWLEHSSDLSNWLMEWGTMVSPPSWLDIPAGWDLQTPADPKHFWRAGGGWPEVGGIDPLAGGLAGLTFVGGSSAGWTFDTSSGILRQDVANSNSAEWVHFGQVYSDFLLRLEYRVSSNGNAGVFVRSAPTGNPWETGSEIQITNEPRAAIHATGSAYGRLPAIPAADARADVWHRMEILMVGNWMRVRVDGVTTVNVIDVQEAFPAFSWPVSGLVGLQDSHNPSGTIEYRNVRILPLTP